MKRLEQTPFITNLLRAAVGDDVDLTTLHVYEIRATSTIPMRNKGGTMYDGAVIQPSTIYELAQRVNAEAVPLVGDHELRGVPYGKFFYAQAAPAENNHLELRGLIYVDDSEDKLLKKLEASTLDEVSISFRSERLECSECGFDHFEPLKQGEYDHFITQTCDKGHTIGVKGVYAKVIGVDDIFELSLVSRGAIKNSKIYGKSSAILDETAQKLAASGVELGDYICLASMDGEKQMDPKEFITELKAQANELAEAKSEVKELTSKLEAAKEEAKALKASCEEQKEELAQLKASSESAEERKELDEKVVAFVNKQYVALKALDGQEDAKAPKELLEAVAFIDEHSARLSALIPTDGASKKAASEPKKPFGGLSASALSAYKSGVSA